MIRYRTNAHQHAPTRTNARAMMTLRCGKAKFPAGFIMLMDVCWRVGTSAPLRSRYPHALNVKRRADPADRPGMEDICNGLSDMYSIEVRLPTRQPLGHANGAAHACVLGQIQRDHFHWGQV